MNQYAITKILSTVLASLAQIILKISANKTYDKKVFEIINPLVIGSYVIFFATVFMSVYALKGISLAYSTILESMSFIFVPLLSRLTLNEKMSKKQLIGMLLIFLGVLVFAFGGVIV